MRALWGVLGILLALFAASTAAVHADPEPRRRSARRHRRITDGVPCASCHTPESWQLDVSRAGDGSFDHARTGFPLGGRHAKARCTDCHAADQRTGRDCNSCHQDPHQQRLGDRCDSCHSAESWQALQVFDVHRRTRFPLTGMHALADCTQCHTRIGEQQWNTPPAECFACHRDDYLSDDVHPLHRGDANQLPFPRTCEQCHQTQSWLPARFDPTLLVAPMAVGAARTALSQRPPNHDLRFVISHGAHAAVACESCHVSASRPRQVQCVGCHAHGEVKLARQHRGQVISPSAEACLGCHPGGSAR